MRLIDADKLIEELKKYTHTNNCEFNGACNSIIGFIKEQPTAFDVDNVISKIWDKSELIHIKHEHSDEIEDYIRVTDATEIVREGEIDEY